MSKSKKIKEITAEGRSNWLEEAGKRIANKGARRNSRKLALLVLETMGRLGLNQTELADRMGVTRQQVSKILKGNENFTFETVDKLEKSLGVVLMNINTPQPSPKAIDINQITVVISVPALAVPSTTVYVSHCFLRDSVFLTQYVESKPVPLIIGRFDFSKCAGIQKATRSIDAQLPFKAVVRIGDGSFGEVDFCEAYNVDRNELSKF